MHRHLDKRNNATLTSGSLLAKSLPRSSTCRLDCRCWTTVAETEAELKLPVLLQT